MLTQSRLKELLKYNPEQGLFFWVNPPSNRAKVGVPCGTVAKNGYVVIRIDRVLHYAHRLSWLYMYGYMPEKKLDHINQIKSDNRILNLRECDDAQNAQNRSRTKGKPGLMGAYKSKLRWTSRIRVDGRDVYLGHFKTEQEAHEAYLSAKQAMHPFST